MIKMKKITFLVLFLLSFIGSNAQNPVSDMHACDSIFDLTTKITEIINGEVGVTISLHLTQTNAQTNVNAITNLTAFHAVSSPQPIFARVLHTNQEVTFTTFNLIIHEVPFSTQLTATACDDNDDGFALVDLTQFNGEWANYPLAQISFHETMTDAEFGMNAIGNPTSYSTMIQNYQTIYIRVVDSISGCFSISTLNILVVNCSNAGQPENLQACLNDNGQACFDLNTNNDNIIGTLNPADYTISYHSNQADASNDVNPLASTLCTIATQAIFARLEKNSDQTYQILTFEVQVVSPPASANYTMQMCDGNTDGYAVFNLYENNYPTNGASVTFYETQNDAVAATNPITNPYNYTNPTPNQHTVYIRYTVNNTCFSVSSLTLSTVNCDAPIMVTNTFTPANLVNILAPCGDVTNIQSTSQCGIGYFTNNNGGFAFDNGVILRSGIATHTSGQYTGQNITSVCSQTGDTMLQQIMTANGQTGTINDATSVQFDFVPQNDIFTFNFVFASNEYGTYQCNFSDVFAFVLTNLNTGATQNLAVVPNTTTPIAVTTIRNNLYNTSCSSINQQYFDKYNAGLPANQTQMNMKGQTVPLSAVATVVPNTPYRIRLAVGDYQDTAFDSAVFIEGGSFSFGQNNCSGFKLNAFLDANGNGVKDATEMNFPLGKFVYEKNNNADVQEISTPLGTYNVYDGVSTNTYDFSYQILTDYAPFYTVTPALYNDVAVVAGTQQEINFAVTVAQPLNDVAAYIIPVEQPRPGFTYKNKIVFGNLGNQTVPSGTVTFTKDPNVTIASTSDAVTTNATGFTYNYTNLQPFEFKMLDVVMQVPTIPTVNIGQTLTDSVFIAPIAMDLVPANNASTNSQIVVGSYDPNDKVESKGDKIVFSEFTNEDYLYYTVRFENTGTAAAENVRIEDTLESQLNPNTIEMLSASHPYIMNRNGNKLTWNFTNIQLPPSSSSYPASTGYVYFRVKPNAGFEVGDIISNYADIYFDYNPAIVTNVATTEFVATLKAETFETTQVSMYPNPASNMVTIQTDNEPINSVKITDVLGKTVAIQTNIDAVSTKISVSNYKSGIYFVEIKTENKKTITKKLVVE